MRKFAKKVSVMLVLAMLIGMFAGVVAASAAPSVWSFSVKKSGKTVAVGETLLMTPNEFAAFELKKEGKLVDASEYTIKWSSDNTKVLWIDAKNGKARAAKDVAKKELTGLYGNMAKVSATFTNVKSGKSATRSFFVMLAPRTKVLSSKNLIVEECYEIEEINPLPIGNGVMVVQRGGLFGAMNEKGDVLVPFEYDFCAASPDSYGNFMLGNGIDIDNWYVDCFDTDGHKFFTIDNPGSLFLNEKYITYVNFPEYSTENVSYTVKTGLVDLETKKEIPLSSFLNQGKSFPSTIITAGISPVMDGKFSIIEEETEDEKQSSFIFDIAKKEWYEVASMDLNRILVANDWDQEGFWIHPIPDENGEKQYVGFVGHRCPDCGQMQLVKTSEILDNLGYLGESIYFPYQFIDGEHACTMDNRIVIQINNINTETRLRSVLLDFAKAKTLEKASVVCQDESLSDDILIATDVSEIIVANEEYIVLTKDNIYFVQHEDAWGYMNGDGEWLGIFDDATEFAEDYAMVLVDGKLNVIDTNMNRYETDIEVDSVISLDHAFCYLKDGKYGTLKVTNK